MSKYTTKMLIAQRSKILAMVQFTSRADLHVSDFPEDGGLDLLVRIVSDNAGYQKFFGVKLFGSLSRFPDVDRVNRFLRTTDWMKKEEGKSSTKYSFPVIVLVFSMEDDKGFFAWSIEPFVNESDEPKLRINEGLSCAPFDRSTLGTIVSRVNEWHDSLVAMLETA